MMTIAKKKKKKKKMMMMMLMMMIGIVTLVIGLINDQNVERFMRN